MQGVRDSDILNVKLIRTTEQVLTSTSAGGEERKVSVPLQMPKLGGSSSSRAIS